MLCKYFAHVGLGDTGEACIRLGVYRFLTRPGKLEMIDSRAHIGLGMLRDSWEQAGYSLADFPPSFTAVRNPFEWRISFYIHELRMRRFQGSFSDFCRFHCPNYLKWFGITAPPIRMYDFFVSGGGEEIDHIMQFEHLKRDLTQVLLQVLPPEVLTAEELDGWFPDIYSCMSGRPWIEAIEQWLKDELYTPDLIDFVYDLDRYFFDRWGYKFEDRYTPDGCSPGSGTAGTVWGYWNAEVSLPDRLGYHIRAYQAEI